MLLVGCELSLGTGFATESSLAGGFWGFTPSLGGFVVGFWGFKLVLVGFCGGFKRFTAAAPLYSF